VNVQSFGAVGDGVTNDRAAIVAALNSGADTIIFDPGDYYIGSSGITIPITVKTFLMSPPAILTYDGLGVAVTVAPRSASVGDYMKIAVQSPLADWDTYNGGTGTDRTSIGVLIENCSFTKIEITLAYRFYTGIKMLGSSGGGTQFCNVTIIDIIDNMIGLQLDANAGGWCNQNWFYGGSINIESFHTTTAGSRYIDLKEGNGNTFIGQSLQGNKSEFPFYCNGGGNLFINQRYEGNSALKFDTGSAYNQIMGGFFSSGTYGIITDAGAARGLGLAVLGVLGVATVSVTFVPTHLNGAMMPAPMVAKPPRCADGPDAHPPSKRASRSGR